MANEIGVSLLGLGVVGSGIAQQLIAKEHTYTQQVGSKLVLNHVLVRDKNKNRDIQISQQLFADSIDQIINDDKTGDKIGDKIGGDY